MPISLSHLSLDNQRSIALSYFGSSETDDLRHYFRYYSSQCIQVAQVSGTGFPLRSVQDVTDVAADIRARISYADIKTRLASRFASSYGSDATKTSESQIDNAISLVIRLLMMLDVGNFQNAYTGRARFVWESGTVDDFLRNIPIFSRNAPTHGSGGKFNAVFNARGIERIAGIKVRLTTNISDHLLLREEMKTLTVFHHASFLKRQQKPLLCYFRKGNQAVQKWYHQLGDADDLDPKAIKCGSPERYIDNYTFWRDRLSILKDAFDEAQPSTLTQWWNDRREGVQWYTLWLAIGFTVFFGLIQSIEGAIQVYKALQS
ncbi:hypothetical protein F4779DRAFT_619987 [Xylariaceae sp. FL0662B]|nr:hypothetical protein F4779DRAFT_619987 [Xylariaceae sp. FL0662B]